MGQDDVTGIISRGEELAYDLKIEQVMTREVKVVAPTTPIMRMLELFQEEHIRGVPVVSQNQLEGVITLENLLQSWRRGTHDSDIVADCMDQKMVTVNTFDPIIEALKVLTQTKSDQLTVIDKNGQLAGIITKGDVTRGLLSALQRDRHSEEVKRYRASYLFEDISSDRTSLILRYHIKARDFTKGGSASSSIKRALLQLGAPPQIARRCGIAIYEAEINLIIHTTNGGEIRVEIEPHQIVMETSDKGPGIENIELVMQPGYSTATDEIRALGFGAGMGLKNIQRCVDEMQLESIPDQGTKLVMKPKAGSKEWAFIREPTPNQGTKLVMKINLQPEDTFSKEIVTT